MQIALGFIEVLSEEEDDIKNGITTRLAIL